MNNIEESVENWSLQWQKERASIQMTLGKLIERLSELNQYTEMDGIWKPHSYRGYYRDLAFDQCDKRLVADVLECVKQCVGKTYIGYKGGEYQMGVDTPAWIASYGHCGTRIMEIKDDGSIVTADE